MTVRLAAAAMAGALALSLAVQGCEPDVPPTQPPPPPAPPPPPPDPAPVAHAGGPYAADSLTIRFDGRASADPDGDAVTFRWDFGDGSGDTGAVVVHTYAMEGRDTVRLVVTDAKGLADTATTTAARTLPSVTFSGAGNIAQCNVWSERTAQILDSLPGAVFTAGDNTIPGGRYQDCYAPTWGRHLERTHVVLGNHEYDPGTADAAFDFFGARAGPRGKGYYSVTVGDWHVIVLNDNGGYVGFGPGSEQAAWLAADLAASTARCTIALWHAPLFLSSSKADYTANSTRRALWEVLDAHGADVVINGHQHHYERMAPARPDGTRDDARGIRQFNVGTGGSSVELPANRHALTEALGAEFGVLSLTLYRDRYAWRFIPAAGQTFTDQGTGTCH